MNKLKGKSLCIFSSKGGVGKTTTALNIAGVFSALEKKVLIIDFDVTGGGIGTYLNKSSDKTIYNFLDDYTNKRFSSINNYIINYNEYISFISAPKDPRQGSRITPNCVEFVLEKTLYDYDYIIIDTNHIFNELNVEIMDKCDLTLLILTNDLLDLKNTRNTVKVFNDAKKDNFKVLLNLSTNPYKIYYSLYEIKSAIRHNVDYLINSSFFIKTFDNYVTDGQILTLDKKMPKYYPEVYKAYKSICLELMEDADEK